MSNSTIHVGDCTATVPGGLFHAILCDPPYELGFMGKDWDASGVAFNPETWRKIGEHLHPGGFMMAFASSRGWHRLACAIEDAGFRIHPSMFLWAQGQGFPKATRIPDERFAGHRYGGQCIKPSCEPVIVAQKPYQGKPVDCITKTGAGALNVDGGRIGFQDGDKPYSYPNGSGGSHGPVSVRINYTNPIEGNPQGRWPANLILLDPEASAALDRQSGVTVSSGGTIKRAGGFARQLEGRTDKPDVIPDGQGYDDKGGSSRFFYQVQHQLDEADPIRYQAKSSRRERDAGLEGLPEKQWFAFQTCNGTSGKPSSLAEGRNTLTRNHHPTVKPIDLARYLATLLLPPAEYAPRRILVPFAGVGSEMIGAMLAGWEEVVGIEMDAEYAEIARRRIEHWAKQSKPAQQELAVA